MLANVRSTSKAILAMSRQGSSHFKKRFQAIREHAKQMEIDLADAITREGALQEEVLDLSSHAKLLETDFAEASRRAKQLEYDNAATNLRKHALQEETSRIGEHAKQLEIDLTEARRISQEHEEEFVKANSVAKQRDVDSADELERTAAQLEDQITRAARQEAQLEDKLTEEKRSNAALQQSLAEIEERLMKTQLLCATTQTDNARMSMFIETVKSSSYWKLKSWLDRLRGM